MARNSAKPQGILVLGMHRSGTSACTRVLNLLGCALPGDLIPVGDGNEAGHWESVAAVTLNDEMLASAGTSWEDWGPLNEDWRQSSVRGEMVGRVMTVVQAHALLGSLFVLKDPRLCRVADVWLEAMGEIGVEPLVLMMLRNPAEVTASLESRDLMAPGYGQLLWLRHVLDAEYYSRGHKRVVGRYDQLMTNWFEMIQRVKSDLGISLPRNSPTVHAEIEQFLSARHRHHAARPETLIANPGLSSWLTRTFAIMLAWSEQGENAADHLELDEIRLQFDRSYSTFARLLLPSGFSGELGSGSRLKQQLANTIAQAQHAASELQIGTEQTEAKLAEAAAREAELAAQIAALRAETERLGVIAAQDDARGVEFFARLAELQSANMQAKAQVEVEQKQRLEAEQLLNEAAEKLYDQQLRNAELSGGFAAAESALVQRQEELSQLWAQLLAAENSSTLSKVNEAKERDQRIAAEQRIAAATKDAAYLQSRLDQARATSALQTDRLSSEIAQLTRMSQAGEAATRAARAAEALERGLRIAAEQRMAVATNDIAGLQSHLDQVRATSALQAGRLSSEIAQLTGMLRDQEMATQAAIASRDAIAQESAARAVEIEGLSASLQHQEAAIRAANTARAAAEQKLAQRFDEIARLTAILADETGKASASDSNVKWLRDAMQLAAGFPKWWALLPQDRRRKREHARFRRNGLLDAEKYLEIYPDVASDGMDPVRHYILHGMVEGRHYPQ